MVGYSKDPNDTPLFLSELPKIFWCFSTDSELTMFDQMVQPKSCYICRQYVSL